MRQSASIRDLLVAIGRLREDEPVHDARKWYRTQKEHWLGWLSEYNGPGAYKRKVTAGRDARFAYNHIVEPKMLVYLAEASGVPQAQAVAAREVLRSKASLASQAAAVRKIVPWGTIEAALWPNSSFQRTFAYGSRR